MYVAKVTSGTCRIYDARTGGLIRSMPESSVVTAQVNGDIVALTLKDGRTITYECKTGRRLRAI